MGKKYMDTKKGSLEQSVLDVWKDAAQMHEEGFDGRTKEYRQHRSKLEAARVRREEKKNKPKMEQPETVHGSGEHAYEVGTDRYDEYTRKITPGQIEETFYALGEQVNPDGTIEYTDKQWDMINEIIDMPDAHFDELLEEMTQEQLTFFVEGIMKGLGKLAGKAARGIGKRLTKGGRAELKVKKAEKAQKAFDDEQKAKQMKKDLKQKKREAGQGVMGKVDKVKKAASDFKSGFKGDDDAPSSAEKSAPSSQDTKSDAPASETGKAADVSTSADKGNDAAGGDEGKGGGGGASSGGNNGDAKAEPATASDSSKSGDAAGERDFDKTSDSSKSGDAAGERDFDKKKKNGNGEKKESFNLDEAFRAASPDWAEPKNLRDTIVSMWSEAASSAVNPKEREELDMDAKNSAKKMKRATEPRPMVASEELEEKLTKKQKQLDVDGDGEIEGSDLAKLRKKAKKEGKSELEIAKEFKVASMKEALAKVWGLEEGGMKRLATGGKEALKGFKPKPKEKKEAKKASTGEDMAAVEIDPKIKEKK